MGKQFYTLNYPVLLNMEMVNALFGNVAAVWVLLKFVESRAHVVLWEYHVCLTVTVVPIALTALHH